MNPFRHWKIILGLTALFIVGVVTGSALTIGIAKRLKERENNEWPQMVYRMYKHRLKLTADQEQKLKPYFSQAGDELRTVRRETVVNVLGVVRKLNQNVEQELTPQQKAEFDKLREEMRAKIEEKQKGKQ